MPRKASPKKYRFETIVGGKTIQVTLHPPVGRRTSWYVYWSGITTSKSTEQINLEDAKKVAVEMIQNGGRRSATALEIPTDEEFEFVQQRHFSKKQGPDAQKRNEKSLVACMEAIRAFRDITGICPISMATPDDCERFQHEALTKPKNWRVNYPKKRMDIGTLSPATVVKWTIALRAAFQRVNRNAGKKCVRGIIPESRLLSLNPWNSFTSIEAPEPTKRHFDSGELISFMDYLENEWPGVKFAAVLAKLHFWSAARRDEVVALKWSDLRCVQGEYHFFVRGKWAVEKWFRIPDSLYKELLSIKCDSEYLFGGYGVELLAFHQRSNRPWVSQRVKKEYNAKNVGNWFYERVKDWSRSSIRGKASTHIFRKTTLQIAREGDDVNRQVAKDAAVSVRVMLAHYVEEGAEQLYSRSNRMYERIIAAMCPEVLTRFGFTETEEDRLRAEIARGMKYGDWSSVVISANKLDLLENPIQPE